jgi:PAS domain S-box-containing protein
VSSRFGGAGPGLLTTALGALAVWYYHFAPVYSRFGGRPEDYSRLVLFVAAGALIARLNGQLRSANQRCGREADAARRSEARAKRLSEANLIGVFFSDLSGNVRRANEEFLRLTGHARVELDSGGAVNRLRITAAEHRGRDERALDELRGRRVCEPFEKDHVHRDGGRLPVLMGCAMLDEPSDEVAGFVLDLSARRHAENAVRDHQSRLSALSSELMMAEERERRRIAMVLHDSVGATLALAKMRLGSLDACHADGSDAAHLNGNGSLDPVIGLIDDALQRTRTLTVELSPPVLYELGLEAAVRWLADRFEEQHGLHVNVHSRGARPALLEEERRLVLFHAVRELLMNVVKHAHVRECDVTLRYDQEAQIAIEVRDAGVGLDGSSKNGKADAGGFGLFNITQRVAHVGGRAEIRAQPRGGTTVTLTVPHLNSTSEQ